MEQSSPETQNFILRELIKGEFLVYSVAPIAGYIYLLEEVINIGDGQENKGKGKLLRAFQFFAKHHRLSENRPPVEKIKSAFSIRVISGDQQVMFADPLEVREATGTDAGFVFDRAMVETFGQGDINNGIERIAHYFENIYERDGTIKNANTEVDLRLTENIQLSTEELAEQEKKKEEAQLQQRLLEEQALSTQNRAALERLLKKVEAWETEVSRDPEG